MPDPPKMPDSALLASLKQQISDLQAQVSILQPLEEEAERPRACLRLPDNHVRGVGQPASPSHTQGLQQPSNPSSDQEDIILDTGQHSVTGLHNSICPDAHVIASHKSPTLRVLEYRHVPETVPRVRERRSSPSWSRTRAFFESIPKNQREWCVKRKELSLDSSEGIIQAYDKILLKSLRGCSIHHAPGSIKHPDFLPYLAKFGEASADAVRSSSCDQKFYRYRLLIFLGLCEVALKNGHTEEVVHNIQRKFHKAQPRGKEAFGSYHAQVPSCDEMGYSMLR